MSFFVHETSFVDDNVSIGDDTKIWHFCHVISGSKIGRNCSFGQNCVIGPNAIIGDGARVQNNVSIYDAVELEEDVFVGPSAVFTNVLNPRAFLPRKHEYKKTIVKKGASLGANCTIVCGVSIGEYALVGAGATVTRDVPAFALVYGSPATIRGWYSKAGYKLLFDENGLAVDEFDGSRYKLENGLVSQL